MATLIMGHGAAETDERVKVPPGHSISFLIDEARVMPFANGVGAVMNSHTLLDEGFSMSSTHGEGDEISNHRIAVLSSDQRSWYAQVDPEDGSCVYAGEQFDSNLALCEDVAGCAASDDGSHACNGLFGMDWSDRDLVWVSCRASGWVSPPQTTIGGDDTEFYALATEAEQNLKSMSDDEFADWFDALAPEEIAQVMAKLAVRGWSFRREARAWLAGGASPEEFYAFVNGQDDTNRRLYVTEADLQAVYDTGQFVRQAREYWQSAGDVEFVRYARGLDTGSRDLLAADPAMGAVLGAASDEPDGDAGDAARYGLTFAEIDWSFVQGVNQSVLKDADAGTSVPYWQAEGRLLVGTEQPETYRKLAERAQGVVDPAGDAPNGHITVASRGGLRSPGELRVDGECDQAAMRSWIAEFSKKKVTFV